MSTAATLEVAHDTILYELLMDVSQAEQQVALTGESLWACATTYVLPGEDVPTRRWYVWTGERRCRRVRPDAIERVEARIASGEDHGGYGEKRLADYWAAVDAINVARDAVVRHERGYGGWNRYFVVTSSAGHVHRSMRCSTCYPETTYAPVVGLSGRTDAEAVAELGSTLCTICFPGAPVAGKVGKITKAAATKILARERSTT